MPREVVFVGVDNYDGQQNVRLVVEKCRDLVSKNIADEIKNLTKVRLFWFKTTLCKFGSCVSLQKINHSNINS